MVGANVEGFEADALEVVGAGAAKCGEVGLIGGGIGDGDGGRADKGQVVLIGGGVKDDDAAIGTVADGVELCELQVGDEQLGSGGELGAIGVGSSGQHEHRSDGDANGDDEDFNKRKTCTS